MISPIICKLRFFSAAFFSLFILIIITISTQAESIDVGSRIEPIVSSLWLDQVSNVSLKSHRPVRRGVVTTFDQAWDSPGNKVTIIQNGQDYHLYYHGTGDNAQPVTCYSQSSDGKIWEKPILYAYPYLGNWLTNIVFTGQNFGTRDFLCLSPFYDDNPNASVNRKYKGLAVIETTTMPAGLSPEEQALWQQGWRWALFGFWSNGAIFWSHIQTEPMMIHGSFDAQPSVFWDETAELYRCYYREYSDPNGDMDRVGPDHYGQIQMCTSSDFSSWSTPQWILMNGQPISNITNCNIFPMPGAEHILLGLPCRYTANRPTKSSAPFETRGAVSIQFMTSRDGLQWEMLEEPWMVPGPVEGRWSVEGYSSVLVNGIVETTPEIASVPSEWSLYALEETNSGTGLTGVRRYTIRPFGFVSAHTNTNGGEFTTPPLQFTGNMLYLNYSTSAAGSVRVEIQYADGSAVPGFELSQSRVHFRDYLKHQIKWIGGSDVSSLQGTSIRLRFVMKEADLFSFQFE
jgi:hypothetical protein